MGWIIVCGIIACITVCVVILVHITEKKAREQVLILQMQQRKMYEMQQAEIKLNNTYKDNVHNTSDRYKYLLKIRNLYKFNFIMDDTIYVDIDTLTKFKTFNIDTFLEDYIRKNKGHIIKESNKVLENSLHLIKYTTDITNAPQFKSSQFCEENNFEYNRYTNIEKQECNLITYRNVKTHKNIEFIIQYTSPAGRNHYEKSVNKDILTLMSILNTIEANDSYKQSEEYKKKHERQLLTPGLRYDIMKRDGFRCAICGRTADDGVKLHVDHIKPISKGGLTVPENLRTLCQDCNLGKSDKYDEDNTDQNVNSDYYIEC